MSEFIHNGDLARKATKLNLPYSASIEIITKCNFKCEHCYIPEHTEEMSYSTIVSIVDQLKELGVFEIMLTGGEIVMHKEFMEVVKYIRKKGMRTILFSNISLLSEEQIRELAEIYITEISTSLFSLEDAINSSITKTMNSTKMVLDKVRLIKKYNIPLEIKVPVMKKNIRCFSEIKQFCEQNEIKIKYGVCITAKTDGDRAPCALGLNQEELNQFIIKNDLMDNVEEEELFQNEYLCDAIGSSMHIDVKGCKECLILNCAI